MLQKTPPGQFRIPSSGDDGGGPSRVIVFIFAALLAILTLVAYGLVKGGS